MRTLLIVLSALLAVVVAGILVCAIARSGDTAPLSQPTDHETTAPPLRLALIPERNIFAQHQRYEALANNLAEHLRRPVQLVSLNTYESVLDEFQAKHIDGAFVGSMLAVLAYDRLGTQVLARPQHVNGASTYTGVIIVRNNSPITDISQLSRRSIAMVRTTTAGSLFPLYLCQKFNMMNDDDRPVFRWVGTHDDVINEVVAGNVDAGAVKNLRLDAYLTEHPEIKLRRLAASDEVPDNSLIVRSDLPDALRDQLTGILLHMDQDEPGRAALAKFGAARFIPCRVEDFGGVYRMTNAIGSAWNLLGVNGPAPRPLPHPQETAP